MASSGASRAASVRNTPSAGGERQMLPRQTNRIRTPLSYAVAAALETGAHRALIVRALAARLLRRHAAGGLGRVEPGLLRRPLVTLVLVARLQIRGVTVLRVDEQIIARW